ncbi:MAG: efflux RND transporter periplasmic adaptor subunit [Verrucomicrobia bacterium]|nr:efflux RND transporter periplasmic adaptor subunit [Verrucomicrobiota bacterium]
MANFQMVTDQNIRTSVSTQSIGNKTVDGDVLNDLKIHRPTVAPKPRRGGLVVGIVLVVCLIVIAIWWPGWRSTIVVRTASAQLGGLSGSATLLNASGYVVARRAATVSSKETGRVLEVLIDEGMHVKEGQVLARLDPVNIQTTLDLAAAQLESARNGLGETAAILEQSKRTLRRVMQLSEKQISTDAELEVARSDVATLEARLGRQRAEVVVAECNLAVYKQQLDDLVIRAPFAGVVTSKNAQPGEMISPMSAGGSYTRTGICTIVDMASLEVEVDVNESYINRVVPGQPVVSTLDSYQDWHIPSKVIAIIPSADRQKATVKVRVGFEAIDSRILPEMSIKVAFQSADNKQLAATRKLIIPKSALKYLDGRAAVWVVNLGRVERRAIAVVETRGDDVEVGSGLAEGENVVVDGHETLNEGVRVIEK